MRGNNTSAASAIQEPHQAAYLAVTGGASEVDSGRLAALARVLAPGSLLGFLEHASREESTKWSQFAKSLSRMDVSFRDESNNGN